LTLTAAVLVDGLQQIVDRAPEQESINTFKPHFSWSSSAIWIASFASAEE
jgi:hypothetical protein